MLNNNKGPEEGSEIAAGSRPAGLRKTKGLRRLFILAIAIVLTFRTFQAFPGMMAINEFWHLVMFGFLSFPYLLWKARSKSLTSFELYILTVIALVPIMSGYAAMKEFGQPLHYGVLAGRTQILCAGALVLIFGFRRKIISLRDVEAALVLMAWLTLGLYFFMKVFLNPEAFANYSKGFVGGGNVEKFQFKFRTEFVIFGFFYYAFLGVRLRAKKAWLLSIPFFAYLLIFEGGRSLIVSLLASFIFFTYRAGSLRRLATLVPKLVGIALVFLLLLYSVSTEQVTERLGKYGDAFTVVLTGEATSDISANARIFETMIAWPYIAKNWLMGNGEISNQWRGGYEGVLGGYFYPSDIGIVGVMYMYGLIGTLLFAYQFRFAWKYSRLLPRKFHTPLIDAVKCYLLYYAIHSLVTGRFAHYPQISIMFIAFLSCIALEYRRSLVKNADTISAAAS